MKTALLVIDVQNVYFSEKLPVTHPPESLSHILQAMDFATEQDIPIVVIQHQSSVMASFNKGSQEWQLHPEIVQRKHSVLIEKTLPGSFTDTHLEEWLRNNDITTVVISGYMTQMCCDTTARQAMHLGFAVKFLSDATGTLNISNDAGSITAEELHRAILITQQMRFSQVLTTREWISQMLEQDKSE